MFNVVDDRDDVFNTTDNDEGDDAADKMSIDDQEDTVDAVDDNRDNLETNKKLPLGGLLFCCCWIL